MSSLNLTNLFYSEKDIGATLKISKRQFIWEFDLNGSSQKIELLDSRLSRKKRLYKNGVNILDTTETGNFIHNFEIDGHACVIIQYGDKIELRIDNQSFTHLYNLQKNKELFAGEKGPTSNTYVAKPYNSYSSNEDKHTESAFYKVNKPEEENKPKLFNFEIKKNTGNKNSGGFNKYTSSNTNNNNNQVNSNNYNKNGNNGGNIDLLGFQDNQNTNQNNANNANNNNLLDFGVNNNNQNQSNNGNDIFNLMGNNTQNQNQQNNMNNNNQFNNIFLQITDGTNQEPKFDQNNLGFLDFNNNNIANNNNMNMNNQGQQINQNNNNNNQNNGQNNGTNIDFLQF